VDRGVGRRVLRGAARRRGGAGGLLGDVGEVGVDHVRRGLMGGRVGRDGVRSIRTAHLECPPLRH
jgi:hypothetical protein